MVDNGEQYSELLGLRTSTIVQNSKNCKTQRFGKLICSRLQVEGERHLLCWVL
jgi:hypothetical protein